MGHGAAGLFSLLKLYRELEPGHDSATGCPALQAVLRCSFPVRSHHLSGYRKGQRLRVNSITTGSIKANRGIAKIEDSPRRGHGWRSSRANASLCNTQRSPGSFHQGSRCSAHRSLPGKLAQILLHFSIADWMLPARMSSIPWRSRICCRATLSWDTGPKSAKPSWFLYGCQNRARS